MKWKITLLLSLSLGSLHAQNPLTRVIGTEDAGVLWPLPDNSLSHQDAAALQALLDYIKAVGVAPWESLKGTGTITYYDDGAELQAGSADIEIKGAELARLTQSVSQKPDVVVTTFRQGQVHYPSGKISQLSPSQSQMGLIDFPKLLSLDFSEPGSWSVSDGGNVSVNGAAAHRITLTFPIYVTKTETVTDVTAIDYYFDPSTHLQMKSVALIKPHPGTTEQYLRQTEYTDYRKVNGREVPFRFVQTFGGQKTWALSLNTVITDATIPDSTFTF